MESALIFCRTIKVNIDTGPGICDISRELEQAVNESGLNNGDLSATIIGSTGSLTAIEYEPGVVADLKDAVNRLAPPGIEYQHELAWHDGNGHSHVQAALLGPSVVIPVRRGALALGPWQQVVLINHDNRPRQRSVEITVIGR